MSEFISTFAMTHLMVPDNSNISLFFSYAMSEAVKLPRLFALFGFCASLSELPQLRCAVFYFDGSLSTKEQSFR